MKLRNTGALTAFALSLSVLATGLLAHPPAADAATSHLWMRNLHTGTCLNADRTQWAAGVPAMVALYPCNGWDNQRWYWNTAMFNDSGELRTHGYANRCLDGWVGPMVKRCNGSRYQRWRMRTIVPNLSGCTAPGANCAYHQFESVAYPGKCLGINWNGPVVNRVVALFPCTVMNNLWWRNSR